MSIHDIDRQFEFAGESNGTVQMKDKDGWTVDLDVGTITEIEKHGEDVHAEWEDVVCPVIFQMTRSDGFDISGELHISGPIDECVDNLVSALEQDVDTDAVDDILDGKASTRRARALIEYLIDMEILDVQNGEVVLHSELDDDTVSQENFIYGGNAGLDYLLTWIGTLERYHDFLDEYYDQVDAKLDSLEKMVEKMGGQRDGLQKELEEARQELFALTDGKELAPAETKANGMAVEAPEEIEDPMERRRFVNLYNRIAMLESTGTGVSGMEDDVIQEAKQRINMIRKELKTTKDTIESQNDRLRVFATMIYDAEDFDPKREFIQNIQEMQQKSMDAMLNFMSASNKVMETTPDDVYGTTEEGLETPITGAEKDLRESQKKAQETEETRQEARDFIAGPPSS